MALPGDLTTFTLTFGHAVNGYTDATGAVALVGVKAKLFPVDLLTDRRLNVLHVATGQEIIPTDVIVTIDDGGKASVGPLPHTDNPTLSPVGFGYRVEWQVASGQRRVAPKDKTIAVPASAGATVDFDLLDVAEAVPGVLVPIGEGPQGDPGLTAYEVAVAEGFVGTEAAWLASLKGDPGDPGDPSVTPEAVAANLPARLSDEELRAASDARYLQITSPAYARTVAGAPPPPPPQLTTIDTFQAGHLWVFQAGSSNADAASNLAATSGAPIGSQYVRMVSLGTGASTPCRLTRPASSPTINMTGKKFAALVRVTNSQNLDNIIFYAGSSGFAAFNNFQLDRYEDDRVKSWFREGEWTWMIFGHEALLAVTGTPPRGAYVDLRFAVYDKGAGGKVTLDVAALASVPEPTGMGGVGVVSFTCDDGRRSQFTTARPVLDKYLYPATAYIIADQIGATSSTLGYEGPMSLADLHQLQDANRWEIAAHSSTAAHHDPPGGFVNLTPDELEAEHLAMKSWLKENRFFGYEHMAYPQGSYNPDVLASVRASYVSGRSVNGFRTDTWPPNDPHKIQSIALSNGITLAAVKARVDRAVQGKGWLVITVHRIDPVGPTDGLTWLTSDFQQLVDYVAASGAAVRTVGQVLNSR